ncbi:MAG: hypothetical protein H6731_01780 [Myxococcales bacterium]|nr:MAG: hypothetical protein H6731_01780 [Myxococcales bacterium]
MLSRSRKNFGSTFSWYYRSTFSLADYESALSTNCYQSLKKFVSEFKELFNNACEEAKKL